VSGVVRSGDDRERRGEERRGRERRQLGMTAVGRGDSDGCGGSSPERELISFTSFRTIYSLVLVQ
jgi:hypothetical protein